MNISKNRLFFFCIMAVSIFCYADKVERKICVVVDGFSTSRVLAEGIKAYGYNCVHVQSSPFIETLAGTLDTYKYLENIHFDGAIEPILAELSPYQVKCVISGADSGIQIADKLAEALNVFPNDASKSLARRNKYFMTKAVAEHGLTTVRMHKSNQLQDIQSWVEEMGCWPIVIKPLESAGGDNVHFCHSMLEVAQAFEKVKNSNNIFGESNVEVLAQTYAAGQEYMINTVAHEGVVLVTDIWRSIKNGAVYEKCETLTAEDREFPFLESYAKEVCKALGIHYGAAHIEVKYDPATGPIFIECGARIMGSTELSLQTEIYGSNQLTLLLESYFNPTFFKFRAKTPRHDVKKYGMTIDLISDRSGIIQNEVNVSEAFKEIASFHCFNFKLKKGDLLKKTVDLMSSPGILYLISENKDQLQADYLKVRQIENHLYESFLLLSP